MKEAIIDRDVIRNHIDAIILSMLAGQDMYGYEMCKEVESRTDGEYELKESSLYSALRRLENLGHVTTYWGDGSKGGRRRYYGMTESGKQYFQHALEEWESVRRVMDKLLGGRK